MRRIVAAALLVMAGLAQPAHAQDVTAEVRTWQGDVFSLSTPSFEVFYTVVPPETAARGAPPAGGLGVVASAVGPELGASAPPGPAVIGTQDPGSIQASAGGVLPVGPDAVQGRRQQQFLRLSRGGVETLVPVSELAALVFVRRQVVASPLPPWAAAHHFHYAATAILGDGSQVQGDYVNLGTSILRGTSEQGTVDIPWTEIEAVRFRR